MTQTPDLHPNSSLKQRKSHDPSHNGHKKVLFNIAGSEDHLYVYSSDPSLQPPPSSSTGNGPISCDASDITGATASTYVSDIGINIEEDNKLPNGGIGLSYSIDDKHDEADDGKYSLCVCVCVCVCVHVCVSEHVNYLPLFEWRESHDPSHNGHKKVLFNMCVKHYMYM